MNAVTISSDIILVFVCRLLNFLANLGLLGDYWDSILSSISDIECSVDKGVGTTPGAGTTHKANLFPSLGVQDLAGVFLVYAIFLCATCIFRLTRRHIYPRVMMATKEMNSEQKYKDFFEADKIGMQELKVADREAIPINLENDKEYGDSVRSYIDLR